MKNNNSKDIKNELRDIVHDLKTPITSIMGFIELLKQSPHDEKTTSEFYDIILAESQKLLKYVNNVLEVYTKEKSSEEEKCNLTIQINKYVKELSPLAEKKNIEILINNNSGDIYLSIPEDKISRILTNIIENAIKYNKDHGKIFINVHQEKNQIIVKIKDTGVGIPGDEINHIFDKYYRSTLTKSMNVEGSGLGLAIASDITRSYGGTIEVNSEINNYTEFTVSFPISNVKENS